MIKYEMYEVDKGPAKGLIIGDVSNNYARQTAELMGNVEYEKEVSNIVLEGDYDLFVDVGAAFGYFSLLAASTGDVQILAVEPHPVRFGWLKWNLRHLPKAIPFSKAIHYIPSLLDMHCTKHPLGLIGDKTMGNKQPLLYKVPTECLDTLINVHSNPVPKKTLIKIDVEGAEMNVLHSMYELLDSTYNNVSVIVEVHTTHVSVEQVDDYFYENDSGYKRTTLWKTPTITGVYYKKLKVL